MAFKSNINNTSWAPKVKGSSKVSCEIYFTMDVEGVRTLKTGVPTTYFVDFPLNLPSFCYDAVGLHVHFSKKELANLSFERILKILKERKEALERACGKEIRYFRSGHLLFNQKLIKAVNKLKMRMVGTNVRYYTAWLPKRKIIFIVHSYNCFVYIKLLIALLKIFHPFAKWKVF